jgi:molybdenum cofactor cytidylyltransferase
VSSVAIAVLAAGASTRLGQPKQLLPFRGRSLVRHAAAVACEAAVGPVAVVVGHEAERVAAELAGLDVTTLRNAAWRDGMGTSIAAAARWARALPRAHALLIATCDQPQVTAPTLRALAAALETGRGTVAACRYAGRLGVPAGFAAEHFGELGALSGDRGARRILEAHRARLTEVACPEAAFDVDAPADVQRLRNLGAPP